MNKEELMKCSKEYLIKQLEYSYKEIERLKQMKLHTEKYASEMEDKYIIANNVINELEKELEDMATLKTDKYGNTRKITHIDINWLLTKIKELKGDDKE